jgi:hypothetical protein
MRRIESECCQCAVPGYPCLGSACPRRNVPVYYCDECDPKLEYPLEEVFEEDGKDVCIDCLKRKHKKITL